MGKIEQTLKSEIQRLARKEIRPMVDPLQKQVRDLTRKINRLSAQLDKISTSARRLEKARIEEVRELKVPKSDLDKARISAGLIKKLRKKLDITQSQLAALVDVSQAAVQSWEQDIARPAGENKAALVALRKLGRRDVQKLLAEKGVAEAGRKPRTEIPAGKKTATTAAAKPKTAKKSKKAKKTGKRAKKAKKKTA